MRWTPTLDAWTGRHHEVRAVVTSRVAVLLDVAARAQRLANGDLGRDLLQGEAVADHVADASVRLLFVLTVVPVDRRLPTALADRRLSNGAHGLTHT